MATGHLEKRSKRGWTIVIDYGRQIDPETGKEKQVRKFHALPKATKGEAQAKLHDMLAAINQNRYVEPTNVTLGEYLENWLQATARPRVGDRTFEDYEGQARNHIKPFMGHLPLVDVRPDDIRGLYASMRSAGLSGSTIRHTHIVLHSALRQAVQDRELAFSPVDSVEPPKIERKERRALTDQEVSLLLTHALSIGRPRQRGGIEWLCSFHELYRTALGSGLRRGELLALKKSELDLEGEIGIIRVKEAISSVKATDKPGRELKRKRPKSEKGLRDVPIDEETTRLLVGLCERNPHDLVFCRSDGTPLDPSTVTHTFQRVAKAAGIEGVSFHSQRHTYVTNLITQGVDPFTAQEMAGHSNISTTQIYVHTLDERKVEAAKRLGLSLPNHGKQQMSSKSEKLTENNNQD